MDTPALIQIDNIAASYANSKGEYGKNQRYRYLQIILEGYTHWNVFNSAKKVNWYAGLIDSHGVIDWPSDMYDYIRIGTPINGQLYTLTKNDNLDMPIGMECGQLTGMDLTQQLSGEPLYWNWCVVDYAATGGHNFAFYRSDKDNRRTVFNGDCLGRLIVIEYVSSGVSLSGETFIPAELNQLLKLYLNWQIKFYADDKNAEYAAREYGIEKDRLRNYQWPFRSDEFLDMIRSNFTRAIKR